MIYPLENLSGETKAAGKTVPGNAVQQAGVHNEVLGEVLLGPDAVHPEVKINTFISMIIPYLNIPLDASYVLTEDASKGSVDSLGFALSGMVRPRSLLCSAQCSTSELLTYRYTAT